MAKIHFQYLTLQYQLRNRPYRVVQSQVLQVHQVRQVLQVRQLVLQDPLGNYSCHEVQMEEHQFPHEDLVRQLLQ